MCVANDTLAHTHTLQTTHTRYKRRTHARTHPSLVCASPRAYLCITIHLVRPQQLRSPRPRIGARARLRPLRRHCCGLNPRHRGGGGGGQARERGGTRSIRIPSAAADWSGAGRRWQPLGSARCSCREVAIRARRAGGAGWVRGRRRRLGPSAEPALTPW